MGFFDMFKKKNAETSVEDNSVNLRDFERDLIQEVALTMFQMKITKQPVLSFFNSDPGIFEGLFYSRTLDLQLQEVARVDFTTYLSVIGSHALGTAAYVVLCQKKYKKSVADFGEAEMQEIAQTIHDNDAYEVGVSALGYKPDGNNKKCLDHIIVTANLAAQKMAGDKMKDKEYQKVYMQVLYNAGITMIYGR